MAYTVPYSSSPPSTPGSRGHGGKRTPIFANSPNELSTTPAGPPPSSALSFTPAGQPPATIFGSSQFGTGLGKLNFGRSAQDSSNRPNPYAISGKEGSFKPLARTKNGTPARRTVGRGVNAQFSSTSQPIASSGKAQDLDNVQDEEAEYSDEMYGEDESLENSFLSDNEPGKPGFQGFTSVSSARGPPGLRSSILSRQSHKSFGSSRGNGLAGNKLRATRTSQLPSKGDDSIMSGIARDLGRRLHAAQLDEPDEIILGTEKIMSQVSSRINDHGLRENEIPRTLSSAANDVLRLWERVPESSKENSPGFYEALELASLWLKIHHPPENKQTSSAIQRLDASSQNDGDLQSLHQPIPKLLLGWLDKYHTSTDETLRPIRMTRPNCTAHELFWETVHALAIRGKLGDIIRLFQAADFKYAISALDDGQTEIGYHGAQLQSVQGAVSRARQLLEMCPAVKEDNWQTDSPEWDEYREQVVVELEELMDNAEGLDPQADDVDDEVFGVPNTSNSIRQRSRQAMSRIPWHVYESLKVLHKILLGSSTEILAIAQDWLEASFALTVWWDGVEVDKIHHWSLSVSRQADMLDENRREMPTFSAKDGPYLRRLKASFLCATDPTLEGSFAVETVRTSEVSLTTVLQNDVESMLRIVRSMSIVICSTLAEIGVYGGWLARSPEDRLGLDRDDLMVLSYGQSSESVSKDDILLQYIDELFSKDEVRTDKEHKEGWEIAISIATRMDDKQKAHDTIQNLLDQLHLTSQDRMDKLIKLCNDLNLKEHAMQVSEVCIIFPS